MRQRRLRLETALLLLPALGACDSAPQPSGQIEVVYELIPIEGLPDRPNPAWGVFAHDINDRGQIAGSSYGRAFLRSADGEMKDLGAPPDSEQSHAMAISEAGVVVGISDTNGFVWTEDGGMRKLPGSEGFSSEPHGVNAAGIVVGAVVSEGLWKAAHWSAEGDLRVRDFIGIGNSVNDDGVIAGELHGPGGPQPATWTVADDPVAIPLGPGETGMALAINAAGAVVGEKEEAGDSSVGPLASHAFLWTREGGLRDLGVPSTLVNGRLKIAAEDINDSLQVVGSAADETISFAFLWDAEHGMRDLNDLIASGEEGPQPVLTGALAINNRGEIVAYSWSAGGASAFLLRPLAPNGE